MCRLLRRASWLSSQLLVGVWCSLLPEKFARMKRGLVGKVSWLIEDLSPANGGADTEWA